MEDERFQRLENKIVELERQLNANNIGTQNVYDKFKELEEKFNSINESKFIKKLQESEDKYNELLESIRAQLGSLREIQDHIGMSEDTLERLKDIANILDR